MEPTPESPGFNRPGRFFASAMNPSIVLHGASVRTVIAPVGGLEGARRRR